MCSCVFLILKQVVEPDKLVVRVYSAWSGVVPSMGSDARCGDATPELLSA